MNNVLGPILGFLLGIPLAYLFFIFKERYKTPRLEYEKISSSSLASINEEVKDKIVLTYDGTAVTDIHSFKVEIKNTRKTPVKDIPIIFKFYDETIEILGIKTSFEPEDKTKHIETSEVGNKRNQKKIVIKPGLDRRDKAIFDIFTKGGKDVSLSSLKIILGEIQGVKWINSSDRLASRWGRIMIFGLILLIIGGYTIFLLGMKAFSPLTTEQIAFIGAQTLIAAIMGALIVVILIIGVVSQLK